jgi:hypothetical protein
VSATELLTLNLASPAVLAFALGLFAALLKSDLRFPESVTSLLSSYLLLAIGIKGGIQIRKTDIGDLAWPMVAALVIGLITPVIAYYGARRFIRLEVANAASIAAHYGSVSAVTFTAAESFAQAAGTIDEGYMAALVALLEVPGIVVAMVIASLVLGALPLKKAVHELFTGKSVMLLIGGIAIGLMASTESMAKVEPFFLGLFPGVLCLFLVDLGTLAGQRLSAIRSAGWRMVAFAVVVPVIFGTFGVVAGTVAGLSVGGAAVLGAMAGSASYIAAPAAVRVGLPEADLGVSLGAALGMTFPFNLAIGIPLYSEIAKLLG